MTTPLTLDAISNDTLNDLKTICGNLNGFTVSDERATLSGGNTREYFLLAHDRGALRGLPEFTFIWIGLGLWQFRYRNGSCTHTTGWESPEKILTQLLDGTSPYLASTEEEAEFKACFDNPKAASIARRLFDAL